MPSPVAHTLAGFCIAALAARRTPAAAAPAVVAAVAVAANLPDIDYSACLLPGVSALDAHQWLTHSLAFVLVGALLLAVAVRRSLPAPRAWPLLAVAGVSHLFLDMLAVDKGPPIGIPLFWPFGTARWHSAWSLFPGIDTSSLFNARNELELVVELALLAPPVLLLLHFGRRAAADGAVR